MRSDAHGLVSGYQISQVTGGGIPVTETGGNLLIGVITLPYDQIMPLTPAAPEPSGTPSERQRPGLENRLASEMVENQLFRQLVERGLADLKQGHYRQVVKEKIESGEV